MFILLRTARWELWIRKGYDADLIVVDGDLQTDLTALQRVRLVVLAGESVS